MDDLSLTSKIDEWRSIFPQLNFLQLSFLDVEEAETLALTVSRQLSQVFVWLNLSLN